MAKMAGPFFPLPGEVIDILETETNACFRYYVLMITKCFLEPVEDTGTEWVGAFVHHSQREIIKKIGASGEFRNKIFPRWVKVGLVEMKEGLIYICKSYKKGTDYFSQNVIKQELAELRKAQIETIQKQSGMENTISEMSGTIAHLLELLSDPERQSGAAPSIQSQPLQIAKVMAPAQGDASALVDADIKTVSTAVMNKMISIFYHRVGQKRVSGTVRQKALAVFKNLLSDGFSPYEVGLAVDWTINPANTKEKIRSFGIIPTTISQAIEAMEAKIQRQEVVEKKEQTQDAAVTKREEEMAMRERLEQIKADMSPDDREKLASRALEELRGMGIYQESMISQVLVGIQENKILSEENNSTGLEDSGD